MTSVVHPLIDALKREIPFVELRAAPNAGDYLEGVLARSDLPACCELLTNALGPALKDFGATATFSLSVQQAIDRFGGIRVDQCLFFKFNQGDRSRAAYAALWPWASDPMRVTLKVGLCEFEENPS